MQKRSLIFLLFGVSLFLSSSTIDTSEPEEQLPNILFIMSDDHTSQVWGVYGLILDSIVRTESIRRLRYEGALLQNAFCTNSICVPSRAIPQRSILPCKGFFRNTGQSRRQTNVPLELYYNHRGKNKEARIKKILRL